MSTSRDLEPSEILLIVMLLVADRVGITPADLIQAATIYKAHPLFQEADSTDSLERWFKQSPSDPS